MHVAGDDLLAQVYWSLGVQNDADEQVLQGLLKGERNGEPAYTKCAKQGPDPHVQCRQRVGQRQHHYHRLGEPAHQSFGDGLHGGAATEDSHHGPPNEHRRHDPDSQDGCRDSPVEEANTGRTENAAGSVGVLLRQCGKYQRDD